MASIHRQMGGRWELDFIYTEMGRRWKLDFIYTEMGRRWNLDFIYTEMGGRWRGWILIHTEIIFLGVVDGFVEKFSPAARAG